MKTSYNKGGNVDTYSDKLTNYMDHDEDQRVQVKNEQGNRATPAARAKFSADADKNGMARHMILNPDPETDWSHDELDRGVRRTMSNIKEERTSISYLYAVHNMSDSGGDHVHVAMTGDQSDLGMYAERGDINDIRNNAAESFGELEKLEAKSHAEDLSDKLDNTFKNDMTVGMGHEH